MSRYVFSYVADGMCQIYMESTPQEDKMDATEDGIAVGFTGNGYLRFWERCRREVDDSLMSGGRQGVGTFSDLWYDEQKEFSSLLSRN